MRVSDSAVICPLHAICSGCSYWELAPVEQRRRKADAVQAVLEGTLGPKVAAGLPVPEWISPIPMGRGRQRLEFQVRGSRIGLFGRADKSGEIVDLEVCHQATPDLEDWLRAVRAVLPAFERAGIRLRVSPTGLRGIWIDLPNEDIKRFLEEGAALTRLMSIADVVEIGQRRKPVLAGEDGKLRLSKQLVFRPWTRTWVGATELPLLSTVGDFSQPSDLCNREIASRIARFTAGSDSILEFGCGNGNLSLPALASASRLVAGEREKRLALAARANYERACEIETSLRAKSYEVREGWLDERAVAEGFDTFLLNPAREGAGKFLSQPIPATVVKIVMMSCHMESYAKDAAALVAAGFTCTEWTLLDQFPQTPHVEIIALWRR